MSLTLSSSWKKIAVFLACALAMCTLAIAATPQVSYAKDIEITSIEITDLKAPYPGQQCYRGASYDNITGYKVKLMSNSTDITGPSFEDKVKITSSWGYGLGYNYNIVVLAETGKTYFATFDFKALDGYRFAQKLYVKVNSDCSWLGDFWSNGWHGSVYSVMTTEKYTVGDTVPNYNLDDKTAVQANIVLSPASATYSGNAIKPDVTVKNGKDTLKAGTDYTYTIKDSKGEKIDSPTAIGLYTVEVTGKGIYSGTIETTYAINPKGVKVASVTPGKKCITVKAKKSTKDNATGYEVRYATSKTALSKAKAVKLSTSYSKVSKKITKLKSKKAYYVQVRVYKKDQGNTLYSAWSSTVKSKKTK